MDSVFQIRRRALSIVLTAIFCSSAHAHDNAGAVPPDGRFTPNEAGAEFPPQPRRIENVRQFGQTQTEALQQDTFAAAALVARVEDPAVSALSNASVSAELGQRYAHLSTARRQGKWDAADVWQEIVYFSYSENQTVNVAYKNGRVVSVNTSAASVDQPALSEVEKAEALSLARQYWIDEGNSQIGTLTGYAIQTFQDDGSPFPSRMVYVSFHVHSPEPPVLVNWVDLSAQQVVISEVAQ
ncbi:MAG: hypothetical protein KTR32_18785 [Granulosicoccus sp.]|nr:hypothetical protein [Granulosicoccus sp.]